MYHDSTLSNAAKHLREVHYLEQEGDIWRLKAEKEGAQASGVVDGGYEQAIPFRQQEFKNAFLEWMICDHVSQR
jgi:hypothetical protein